MIKNKNVYKSTCFHGISEAKDRENIDCYCSEKPPQNQLEILLMVKLVELYRLKKGILVISFLEIFCLP